jgi:hypothetical protein
MRNPDDLLAKKNLVDQYLKLQTHQLSTFHFSSIFLWQDFFDFDFEIIEDSLCIFANQKDSSFLYFPPLSDSWKPSVAQECFIKMNKINPRTARIENIEQAQLNLLGDQYKANVKSHEYVYQKEDLVQFKGQAYKSQRHDIHHFQAREPNVFRPYEPEDLKACLDLYERWARNRYNKHEDEVYRQMLQENRIVHELALNDYKPLGLVGYVVEIDQKIAAYSFGYSLNAQNFCVLLEITNIDVIGLSAFIFNRVCADEVLREHALINTMDDFGLPYVAASKQAYHPFQKPISYTVTQVK